MLRVDEIISVLNFKFPKMRMATITPTSPLHLMEIRRYLRRAAAMLDLRDYNPPFGGKKRIPDNFCYVCSQLDPRGSRGRNPYRYLFADGSLRPCKHVPPAPHPTFVSEDEDGLDDDSIDFDDSDDGAMFDTRIIRQDDEEDPRLFALPPVFGKEDPAVKKKRRGKDGRLVPLVSENTFLTTNKRERRASKDKTGSDAEGVRLPRLSNQRASLVTEEQGQGRRQKKAKDPRRLNSDRVGRRDLDPGVAEVMARSGSSAAMAGEEEDGLGYLPEPKSFLSSREKTDPPPQPIIVSIRNQDGEVVERIPLENLPPGSYVTDDMVTNGETRKSRRKREKKRRARSPTGSASPTFSGSMSISRETTLSGIDSPEFFFSRVRSATWCECPDHVTSESRCAECRKTSGHEKWCVSRNSLCQKCGKAIRRKYSQMERKSSIGNLPGSGMIISNVFQPSSESPTRSKRHCSTSKTSLERHESSLMEKAGKEEVSGRVRFQEGENVVYPQWESFPDSGIEDEKHDVTGVGQSLGIQTDRRPFGVMDNSAYQSNRSFDYDVHRKAYDLALASSRAKKMFSKKSKGVESSPRYFSYFPLLKIKRPKAPSGEETQQQEEVTPRIGVRGDAREGKKLKVKKGLKHVLGDVKLEDYYPGGKLYPRPRQQKTKK